MPAHPKTTDTQIIQAARRLVEIEGRDGFSMNDVAAAVGIRAPSLYGRFKDRAGLLAAVELHVCADFEHLLMNHGIDFNYVRAGSRVHEDLQAVFAADMHQAQLHGEQKLNWEAFLGQTMSLSVVPSPNHPRSAEFNRLLRDYFNAHAVDGVLTAPTTCWISVGRLSTQ